MFGEKDTVVSFGQNDEIIKSSPVDEYNNFDNNTKARVDNTMFYSSLTGNDPNELFDYEPQINKEIYGEGISDLSAWGKNDVLIKGTTRTLTEKLKNFTAVDFMAKMPFSPWHDYAKKGYDYAKKKLKSGKYAQGKWGMTPMGGYTMTELPFTQKELKQIVKDYEEEAARPQSIPASIFDGVTALPAYMIEFGVGGSAAESLGLATTGVKGIVAASGVRTALQPSRVASSLIDQKIKGEEGATALLKAYGDVYIENITEAAGEHAFPLLKKMPFGGKLITQMEKYAAKIGMPKSEFVSRISTKAGWNGLLGEWGEERLATFLRAIFDVEDFGAGPNSNIADRMAAGLMADMKLENQLTELGVLSFPLGTKMILDATLSDAPIEVEKPVVQEATQKPSVAPVKAEAKEGVQAPTKPTLAKPAPQAQAEAVEAGQVEITSEETKILEAEAAEVVRPNLYIGNVTEGMKKRIADTMGWSAEDVRGFEEKGWPTKRTEVPLTRDEAEIALEDLTDDLQSRLDNNKIRTENDLAFANAMWGNIAEMRKALDMEKGQAPFKVIRAKGQPMKVIKNAKSRIWAAVQPGTLQESKMTVGEVLRAVVKGKAREAKMAWAAGRRELRTQIRAKAKAKKRMESALKSIKKEIPESVDYYYREAIETLREGIDLKVKTEKAKASIERTREFLERAPEHAEKMPTELMKRLYKKPLIDYTIEELEQIASEIDKLVEQGKLKRKLTLKKQTEFRESEINDMIEIAEKGGTIKEKEVIVSSKTRTGEKIRKPFIWTWRPSRILDWLDNRKQFKGEFHHTFYDWVKDSKDKAWRWTDSRINPGKARMKELGLSPWTLAKNRINIRGEHLTLDKMIGVYILSKNNLSHLAMIYGNKFTGEEIADIINNLSSEEKAWGDYILEDYKRQYPRLRASTIEQENRDPGSQEFYVPIRRMEVDYTVFEKELIGEMLHRAGLKKAYAEHGFTLERKNIPPEFQKPIRLEATSMWLEQVSKQEHYMNIGPVVRELNKILNNKRFNEVITKRGGAALPKWFRNYVNAVANPNFYKTFDDIERISRTFRQNSAIAYLGFNIVTMMKQLPSVFLYMHEAGVQNLMQSAIEFVQNPMDMISKVRGLDPFVKHRMIERELAELHNIRTGTIGLLHQQVGIYGMEGIYLFDMVARTIGWNAVYNKAKLQNMSEQEAIKEARNATLRTQPAAAAEDLPQLYRTNEYLNILTMFTNQLNQIFNIATYDMPSLIKNQQYADAALGGLGLSIVAATIWMIAHRKFPEEPEEIIEIFGEQAINSIPLFGKYIQATRQGWDSDIPVIEAISNILGLPIKVFEDMDISEYEFKQILEAIAVVTGTPYVQPERIYRAAKEKQPSVILGGKAKSGKRRKVVKKKEIKEKKVK